MSVAGVEEENTAIYVTFPEEQIHVRWVFDEF